MYAPGLPKTAAHRDVSQEECQQMEVTKRDREICVETSSSELALDWQTLSVRGGWPLRPALRVADDKK
jgi:hypothetical protein